MNEWLLLADAYILLPNKLWFYFYCQSALPQSFHITKYCILLQYFNFHKFFNFLLYERVVLLIKILHHQVLYCALLCHVIAILNSYLMLLILSMILCIKLLKSFLNVHKHVVFNQQSERTFKIFKLSFFQLNH